MGRGDKRTKKGKIAAKSFGKSRPRKKVIKQAVPKVSVSENAADTSND